CLLIYAHENCLHHGHPSFSLIPSTTLFRSEHRVQFDGTTFTITLLTHRPAGAMCTMALEPFTRTVPLDVEGLEPGEYTVRAGDQTASFRLGGPPPDEGQAAPTDSSRSEEHT